MNYQVETIQKGSTYSMVMQNPTSPNLRFVGKCMITKFENSVYIDMISVSANYRKQGIFSEFLNLVIRFCKGHDIDLIRLSAFPLEKKMKLDTLVSIYEKKGFLTEKIVDDKHHYRYHDMVLKLS